MPQPAELTKIANEDSEHGIDTKHIPLLNYVFDKRNLRALVTPLNVITRHGNGYTILPRVVPFEIHKVGKELFSVIRGYYLGEVEEREGKYIAWYYSFSRKIWI